MAMTALGAETSIDKFRKAGAKPFVLASILYMADSKRILSGEIYGAYIYVKTICNNL